MQRLAWIGAAALAALLALTAAACTGGNKAGGASGKRTIVLTFASELAGQQPDQLLSFADEVTKLSGGTIRIEFRGDWRRGDAHQEVDAIQDVRAGKVDLAWVGARAWDWLGVHSFDALVAPFLINSYQLERRVFARRMPQKMLVGLQRTGVVGIGVLPGPMRKVLGVRRRLVSTADFHGLRFGVTGIVAAETLRALGARPKQTFAQEPLTGLSGVESQLGAIAGLSYDTANSYLGGNLNLWPRPLVLFASPRIFRSLSAAQQRALRQAGNAAVASAMNGSVHEDISAMLPLCARHKLHFFTLTQAQLRALARAVAPVYQRLSRDAATRRAISEIQAMKRTSPPPPAIECSRSSTTTSRMATPIDGTWQMTVTASQLRGDKADAGTYRFSLHDGHMEFSDAGTYGTSRDTGTYTVRGDLVIFHNTAGHDVGETSSFRWSIYRGELTLRKPPPNAPLGAPNPTFAPWHRVGR